MFTGIVQATGTVDGIESRSGDVRLRVRCPTLSLDGATRGDSIAVNGVCLTAVAFDGEGFEADVSRETLNLTTLGRMRAGSRVNLEKSLTLATPLGGHLVTGHVDGVGEVLSRAGEGRSIRFVISVPEDLARYVARKGSVCIDGVSLTVNRVEGASFEVNIVPHTLEATTLDEWVPGHRVNLEVDIVARYLERLLGEATPGGLTFDMLKEAGFAERH
jgi:riboflavin synthase